jgi:ABC-type Co2+ transport system permease subunit
MVLGSLGGLEVSIREHFAGFKSHTTLLAASTAVLSMIVISAVGGTSGLAVLGIVVAVGVLVFVLAFWGFRQAFMRRSGGLGFR